MRSPTRSMISQLYARHVTSVSITSKLWTHRCRRSTIPASYHFITSSCNNPSSRKRPATLSSHKLYTLCFTSRHHEISNKIHDLTTLCASCHECLDYIKTLLHITSSILQIIQSHHFVLNHIVSSRKRHATLCIVTKLYTRIDPWSFRFL